MQWDELQPAKYTSPGSRAQAIMAAAGADGAAHTTPADVPEACPGTSSAQAGKEDACRGCPNQAVCASGEAQQAADALVSDRLAVQRSLCNVRHRVLVLSGKGGVGKSTVCAHLATAFAEPTDGEMPQIGVLDVDLCGPSMPQMLGVDGEAMHASALGIAPVVAGDAGNISVVSAGFLLGPDDALIWRGGRKHALIRRLLADVQWDELDWMFVDTPPGTSDEHLALSQLLQPLTGAVLVTAPQHVAWQDVRRQVDFCRRSGIRVLGVVENMASYACPACGAEAPLVGGDRRSFRDYLTAHNIPLLGSVPIDPRIAMACDVGLSCGDNVDSLHGSRLEEDNGSCIDRGAFLDNDQSALLPSDSPAMDAYRRIASALRSVVEESSEA